MTVLEAAALLCQGGLVVFPTETVYGLGALASHEEAVRRVFEVKGRPPKNPLIVHIGERSQLKDLVRDIPAKAELLMDRFWPGPLTICFHKQDQVSDLITAGLPTVCVRCPSDPTAQALLRQVGEPLVAPSANLSGKPSTTHFRDALAQLDDKGVSFLPGEECPYGLESTVVDVTTERVRILRPGSITRVDLEQALGEPVDEAFETDGEVTSPGQLFQHYAPDGNLRVIVGSEDQRRHWLNQQVFPHNQVALGLVGNLDQTVFSGHIYQLSEQEEDLASYASQLYSFLNWCDGVSAREIILELPYQAQQALFPTLLNRLKKASKDQILWLDEQQ